MVEIIREFLVKEDARARFELAFGPGGAWSTLVARCPGFRGTTLLSDTKDPRRFWTIDLWESEAHREQLGGEQAAALAALDATFAELIESSAELGVFRIRAEGTVRPLGKPRGRGRGTPAGRRRR